MGMFIHRRKEHLRKTQSSAIVDNHKEEASEKKTVANSVQVSSLTEEDINKLPYFSLKSLASTYGIDVTDKKTKQLRVELLEKIKEG